MPMSWKLYSYKDSLEITGEFWNLPRHETKSVTIKTFKLADKLHGLLIQKKKKEEHCNEHLKAEASNFVILLYGDF